MFTFLICTSHAFAWASLTVSVYRYRHVWLKSSNCFFFFIGTYFNFCSRKLYLPFFLHQRGIKCLRVSKTNMHVGNRGKKNTNPQCLRFFSSLKYFLFIYLFVSLSPLPIPAFENTTNICHRCQFAMVTAFPNICKSC